MYTTILGHYANGVQQIHLKLLDHLTIELVLSPNEKGRKAPSRKEYDTFTFKTLWYFPENALDKKYRQNRLTQEGGCRSMLSKAILFVILVCLQVLTSVLPFAIKQIINNLKVHKH